MFTRTSQHAQNALEIEKEASNKMRDKRLEFEAARHRSEAGLATIWNRQLYYIMVKFHN